MQSFSGRKQVMQNICLQVSSIQDVSTIKILGHGNRTSKDHRNTMDSNRSPPRGVPLDQWGGTFSPHGRRLAIWQLRAVLQRFPKRGLSWRHVVPTNRGRRPGSKRSHVARCRGCRGSWDSTLFCCYDGGELRWSNLTRPNLVYSDCSDEDALIWFSWFLGACTKFGVHLACFELLMAQ